MRLFKATYRDRQGNRRKTAKWYVEFRDHTGATRRLAANTDKHASTEFGRKLERLSVCRASGATVDVEIARWLETLSNGLMEKLQGLGLVDSRQAAAGKCLSNHIDDWCRSLKNGGASKKHSEQQPGRVRRLCEGCDARFWNDLTLEFVHQWLADAIEKGQFGEATANHYLGALKTFAHWMERNGRATVNPFKHLSKRNAATDVRVRRRALTPNERRRLLYAAASGEPYRGISGTERAVIYRIALETGLRWSEIRSLKKTSFDLNADPPTVTVEAAYSKHRRDDVLPLRGDSVEVLREHLTEKLPHTKAFSISHDRGADMLRIDLERAGILYEDASGRICDFHALRHTFVT